MSAAKKTQKVIWHTSVLFTGNIKSPNSVSKTTKPISIQFYQMIKNFNLKEGLKMKNYGKKLEIKETN